MAAKPRLLTVLDYGTTLLFIVAIGMVFFYAPLEVVMGQVQRLFYFHVATWWVGMLGLVVAAISGIAYLRTSKSRWDVIGLAAVEISIVFVFLGIVTGSIWARPAWNTWWTWDPRLTTAAVLELIYIAYLMLRQSISDPDRRARFGAVYALVGSISVPITWFSIRLFRTIHPVVVGSGSPTAEGGFDMTPRMVQTFMVSLLTFSFLFITLLWHRIRLGDLSEKVERLRLKVSI
jgi:heme exporter protein C